MLKFPAEDFIGVLTVISDLAGRLEADNIDPNQLIPVEHCKTIKPLMVRVRELADELDLDVSLRLICKIEENLKSGYTVRRLRRSLTELKNRLAHETGVSPLIFRISKKNAEYMYAEPFGSVTTKQFPSSVGDIEDAARCLAFECPSACVMHLGKVVESALMAFITYSQLPAQILQKLKKDPNWGNIMTPMRDEFRKRDEEKIWPQGVDREFCQSIRAFGDSVRVAWRNPAMHVGSHYTQDEAVDIYHAVKSFMRTLAAQIHESGNVAKV